MIKAAVVSHFLHLSLNSEGMNSVDQSDMDQSASSSTPFIIV